MNNGAMLYQFVGGCGLIMQLIVNVEFSIEQWYFQHLTYVLITVENPCQ